MAEHATREQGRRILALAAGRIAANRWMLAAGVAALTFSGSALAQQTIKIGSVLSVTGPASFLGEPEDKTLRMYVDKINAAGGVNGKKIELVIYDDGGDANKARTFATRLIEDDKVVAMAGGSTTGTYGSSATTAV